MAPEKRKEKKTIKSLRERKVSKAVEEDKSRDLSAVFEY